MKIRIPDYVNTLLKRLEKNNFEAFIVGGSVRDALLGIEASDYDIATNAHPGEIEELFKDFKTIEVGRKFGTIVVVQDEGNIEITTYRIEEEYIDGRRPSEVSFTRNVVEDLKRRDFTINAIAYSEKEGLIDPFNGRNDLKNKIIKTVGDARERFSEDHLRILRCIRFSSTLEFEIEVDTLKAAKEMGHLLEEISVERIRDELFKILLSNKPSLGIRLLDRLNILEIVVVELTESIGFNQHNPYHEMDVFEHTLCVVDNTPPIIEIRLAALFHDIAKPRTFSLDENGIGHFYGHQDMGAGMAKKILQRFNTSKKIIEAVSILIKNHMTSHNKYSKKKLKRLINRVGEGQIFNLLDLQIADMRCTSENRDISFLNSRKKEINRILEEDEPVVKKQLAIDGNDIVKLGYAEGRIIGDILDYLLELVLENPKLNEKETLLKIVLSKFIIK